jgi:hypothetical protein
MSEPQYRQKLVELRRPFGISAITSWWQPGTIGEPCPETTSGDLDYLPSVKATLEAGIPAIDYYFVGYNEQDCWRKILRLKEGGKGSETWQHMVDHMSFAAPQIRAVFRALPKTSQVHRGYARVVALATNVKAISRVAATWQYQDRRASVAPLLKAWRLRNQGSAPPCPLLPVEAALVVASSVSAPVVELVGGLRIDPRLDAAAPAEGRYMWVDEFLSPPRGGAPSPRNRLVDNLFWLATFILTKLPPKTLPTGAGLDDRVVPPVTLALEIEHGSGYLLNSLGAYRRVRQEYDRLVEERVSLLETCRERDDCLRTFQQFGTIANPTVANWCQLRSLYGSCIGLNVDVGHMFLIGARPWDVSSFVWQGESICRWKTARDRTPTVVEANPEPLPAHDLTREVVHYHVSDHRGVHYADLPPGCYHAARDFEPWLRQAYAVAQMDRWREALPDHYPLVHPNLTRHVAIELEASIAGQDQLVTTFALAQHWLRRFTSN